MTAKSWRRIGTWTIRILLLAVLGIIAFAIAVLTVIPRASHGTALTVLTGSMTPGIPVGSVVIDRPVDPGTLHVGDVATYQKQPGKAEYITHRIVKIDTSTTPAMFTFKGDANRGPDGTPVSATAIRGKVWFHVPYLGALRDALHTRGGLAGVAMLLLAGYALYQGLVALKERKTEPAKSVEADVIDLERAHPLFSLLMTVRADAFEGLAPEAVARALGGTLVEFDDDTFTLRVAEADRARDALELIDAVAV
jgi:signal peptidase